MPDGQQPETELEEEVSAYDPDYEWQVTEERGLDDSEIERKYTIESPRAGWVPPIGSGAD